MYRTSKLTIKQPFNLQCVVYFTGKDKVRKTCFVNDIDSLLGFFCSCFVLLFLLTGNSGTERKLLLMSREHLG